jgi:hypothetical protein
MKVNVDGEQKKIELRMISGHGKRTLGKFELEGIEWIKLIQKRLIYLLFFTSHCVPERILNEAFKSCSFFVPIRTCSFS